MPINHALVVDDSRSARVALQKLLEEQGLEVSLSASGEEALDFLKKNQPDVIFMDHTMPGMDGLEAVGAIKANPKTATIPVMMYTTREGEVYVGQARALGAVGVMPKNVQPHQLFEMLADLGLVKDRRSEAKQDPESEVALEQQAVGISVQNLVGRILEDQHMTLRSDILRSQRTFAKEVAKEIVLEQARSEELAAEKIEEPGGQFSRSLSLLLTAIAVVALFFAYQFKGQRDEALDAMQDLESEHADFVATDVAALQTALDQVGDSDRSAKESAFAALEWAINNGNTASFDELALGPGLAEKTDELISHLQEIGFNGELVMTSHLGRFCLNLDESGGYRLAPDDQPMLQCDYIGHPEDNSSRVTDRLSVPFSRLYTRQLDTDIQISLVALDASESRDLTAYPLSDATAGDWNSVAELNNRVEIQVVEDR